MLNPKDYQRKDLDQAVRLYDFFVYCVEQADTSIGKGHFYKARRYLEEAIKMTHSLESLKDEKLLHDLKHEVDQQNIVEKMLRWRR